MLFRSEGEGQREKEGCALRLLRGLCSGCVESAVLCVSTGKPPQGRAVRLQSRTLSSALLKWEQAEVEAGAGSALPLYCQGAFDAVTTGQSQVEPSTLYINCKSCSFALHGLK